MHRLTQTQLHRHLDRAIEILRPSVTDYYAVEIIMALLILKRASDQMAPDTRETIERPVATRKEENR